MAQLIDGKAISAQIKEEVKEKVAALKEQGCEVTLAVIQVGADPASSVYVRNKKKACEYVGVRSLAYELPEETTEEKLLELIREMNDRTDVNGILVQLPLPKHIDEEKVLDAISPLKDVDGFTPENLGAILRGQEPFAYPCTPFGILTILKRYNIQISGKHAVIVGRSNIVGKPVSLMLLKENATVTMCHSKTENLSEITKTADILISATGKRVITKDMVKQGATVIDVGIIRNSEGKLEGDVDFEEVKDVAEFITPVPGGVGPMTIASLMKNTLHLFYKQEQ